MTTRLPDRPPRDANVAVRLCEPLCRTLTALHYAPGVDRDDLLQVARVGAWEAWRDWRPDGGSSFGGFARLCITRQLVTTVRAAHCLKHKPVNDAVRFEAPANERREDWTVADTIAFGNRHDPTFDRVEARDALRRALWAVELHLSALERDVVIGLTVGDESYRAIAERLGKRVKSVDNSLQRARGKLSRPVEIPGRRHAGVYIARQDDPTRMGCATATDAIAAARGMLGEAYVDAAVVSCVKSVLGPDGRERRDTRGRPRNDGRRPVPVWRVVLERSDLPSRLAA